MSRADWLVAVKLAIIGNLLYYLCVASAIQRAGGPLPTMIIGTLPVTIAVTANLSAGRDGRLPWIRLAPALALIIIGMGFVNNVEIAALRDGAADTTRYAQGALLAFGAVACWTWYPLRNAVWLRANPDPIRACGPQLKASPRCRWPSPVTCCSGRAWDLRAMTLQCLPALGPACSSG